MRKKNPFSDGKNHTGSVFAHAPLSISLLFLTLTSDGDKCKGIPTLQRNKELHPLSLHSKHLLVVTDIATDTQAIISTFTALKVRGTVAYLLKV